MALQKMRQFLSQITEVEEPINLAQQMIGRDTILKAELIKQLGLIVVLPPHHSGRFQHPVPPNGITSHPSCSQSRLSSAQAPTDRAHSPDRRPGDWLIEHTGAPLNLARGGGSDRRRIAEMLITGMTVAEVNTAAKRLSRWAESCADVLINVRSGYIRLRNPSSAHAA